MDHPDTRPVYALVLRALPWSTPPIHRLRSALKCLLRTFGLRCTDLRLIAPDPPANGQPPDATAPASADGARPLTEDTP
jgi:hypothetical protein